MTKELAREARELSKRLQIAADQPLITDDHISTLTLAARLSADLLTRLAAALDGAPAAPDGLVETGFCFDMSKAPLVGQEDTCRVVLTDGRTVAVCYAEDGEWLVQWDGSTFYQPSGWLLLPPFSHEAAALPAPTPAPEPGVTKGLAAEIVGRLLSFCDPSNWDSDGKRGDYYQGWKDATDELHEIASDYQERAYAEAAPSQSYTHTTTRR